MCGYKSLAQSALAAYILHIASTFLEQREVLSLVVEGVSRPTQQVRTCQAVVNHGPAST